MSTPHPAIPASVVVRPERGVHVMVFPTGKIDGNAVREVYEQTVAHIAVANARLLVDLTGVQHVSSAGIGMFVTLRKKCLGVGSQMNIAVPNPQVMNVFNIMRLELVLPLYPTREQAFAAFKPPA